jgi:hypothetical protein
MICQAGKAPLLGVTYNQTDRAMKNNHTDRNDPHVDVLASNYPPCGDSLVYEAFIWQVYAGYITRPVFAYEKAAAAVSFSYRSRVLDLYLPTKLEGTRNHQEALASLPSIPRLYPLSLWRAGSSLLVGHAGVILGTIKKRHLPWVNPLFDTGLVRCHIIEVTGGPANNRKRYGCNVALSGLTAAIKQRYLSE